MGFFLMMILCKTKTIKFKLEKKKKKMAREKAYLSYGVVTGVELSFNFVLLKLPYGVVELLVLPVYLNGFMFFF